LLHGYYYKHTYFVVSFSFLVVEKHDIRLVLETTKEDTKGGCSWWLGLSLNNKKHTLAVWWWWSSLSSSWW